MNDRLANLGTGVLVMCAVVVTGLTVRREFFAPPRPGEPRQGVLVDNWRAIVQEPAAPAAGAVRVVVFADYTCRFCRQLETALDSLRSGRGAEEVQVRHLHYPLQPSGTGFAAAVAAECAADQRRGPEYHRLLYAHQDALGALPWDSLAALAGVPDRAAFNACVGEQRTAGAVNRDRARGEAIGVDATPTFLINGRRYVGRRTYAELRNDIERATR